jgi:hypothetical protein
MTFDPDIGDDALLVDGLETVTLTGTSTVTVSGAKRGELTTAEADLERELLSAGDLAWLLPVASLGGVTPRPGDTIADANATVWSIESARYSPLTQVWRAVGRRQR